MVVELLFICSVAEHFMLIKVFCYRTLLVNAAAVLNLRL